MPPLPPIPPQYRFTPAELEVLAAIADGGITYPLIALRIGREVTTAKTHVRHVYDKLGRVRGTTPILRIMHWLWEQEGHARTTQKAA